LLIELTDDELDLLLQEAIRLETTLSKLHKKANKLKPAEQDKIRHLLVVNNNIKHKLITGLSRNPTKDFPKIDGDGMNDG
jgi:hypothetical protein